MPLDTLIIASATSLILTPLARALGLRWGLVSRPRADRWHRSVIPYLGGVGAFTGFFLALGLTHPEILPQNWGLLSGAALIFLVGLYDDIRELSPPAKLTAQIMAATLVIFNGYRTGFFASELPNILVTVVWLVGITNAINLLDNMDGLAGGISLIAAGFLGFFFWRGGQDLPLLIIAAALFGGILGFLVFNFPPAKIFMGDNGSLFIGFTLAALAIARKPQASNVFAVMSVPALLFLLPIMDTAFVTFTRLLRGQSPAHGGRDHTSHRLVAFGLSVRQTVLLLYGAAIVSGVAGAAIEAVDYTLSLVLIPILVVSFAVLAAYLSRLKVVDSPGQASPIAHFLSEMTYRRRALEIALDFFLISIAFYSASWLRGGLALDPAGIEALVRGLPFALGGAYASYFLFGVYRSVWGYTGMTDLLLFARAALGAGALTGMSVWLVFPAQPPSWGLLVLFALLTFLALAASRSSFRIMDLFYRRQLGPQPDETTNVLVYGTGDGGDLVQRWVENNPDLGFRLAGFLDDDAFKWGRKIHGVLVLGSPEALPGILEGNRVAGVIVAPENDGSPGFETLLEACRSHGVWVRIAQMHLVEA